MRRFITAWTCIFLLCSTRPLFPADFRGGPEWDGFEVTIDLPESERVQNFGIRNARGENVGMCVWTSLAMAAHWMNVEELADVHHKVKEGGGWPEKMDRVLKAFAPDLQYLNIETNDPAYLDKAMRTGRCVCITYGKGDFYGTESISHMVLLVHLDRTKAAIIDNNDSKVVTWMTRGAAGPLDMEGRPGGQADGEDGMARDPPRTAPAPPAPQVVIRVSTGRPRR